MTETTYKVYQRSGNRWVCVGSFTDTNKKEGLFKFLHQNGVRWTPNKWSAR